MAQYSRISAHIAVRRHCRVIIDLFEKCRRLTQWISSLHCCLSVAVSTAVLPSNQTNILIVLYVSVPEILAMRINQAQTSFISDLCLYFHLCFRLTVCAFDTQSCYSHGSLRTFLVSGNKCDWIENIKTTCRMVSICSQSLYSVTWLNVTKLPLETNLG